MRKFIILAAFALGISSGASADQATLKAIEDAGVTLTAEQAQSLSELRCNITKEQVDEGNISLGCQSLVDTIASIIASNTGNDVAIERVLRAAAIVHPELIQPIGDAAIASAPDSVALIAGLITELNPAAAGPAGLAALATGNIPAANTPGNSPGVTPADGGSTPPDSSPS